MIESGWWSILSYRLVRSSSYNMHRSAIVQLNMRTSLLISTTVGHRCSDKKNSPTVLPFPWTISGHLDTQIRVSFTAQRDKLLAKVRQVAVENAEKELIIDRRVGVVLHRLRGEQHVELRTLEKLFKEHLHRADHFVRGAGGKSRSENFTPFAALNVSKEGGAGEAGEQKGATSSGAASPNRSRTEGGSGSPGRAPGNLYVKKTFVPFCDDGTTKDPAPEFDPTAIFEFASKLLCEEMRILEHRKISLPERKDDLVHQRSVASHGGRKRPASSMGRMMRERRPGWDPVYSAYNHTIMEEFRRSGPGFGPTVSPSSRGAMKSANRSGSPLLASRPERRSNRDLFSRSYADMYNKRDVYVAQPSPPPAVSRGQCGFCDKDLLTPPTNKCVLQDAVTATSYRFVVNCCSWACCEEWNLSYSPPYLREARAQYIEDRRAGRDLVGGTTSAGGGDGTDAAEDGAKAAVGIGASGLQDGRTFVTERTGALPATLADRFGNEIKPEGPTEKTFLHEEDRPVAVGKNPVAGEDGANVDGGAGSGAEDAVGGGAENGTSQPAEEHEAAKDGEILPEEEGAAVVAGDEEAVAEDEEEVVASGEEQDPAPT